MKTFALWWHPVCGQWLPCTVRDNSIASAGHRCALVILLAKVTLQVLPLSNTLSGTRALSLPCSTTPAAGQQREPTLK